MKKMLLLLLPLALACGESTAPPEATKVPVPTPNPCVPTGIVGDGGAVYQGDCELSDTCRSSNDNFYVGECKTRS